MRIDFVVFANVAAAVRHMFADTHGASLSGPHPLCARRFSRIVIFLMFAFKKRKRAEAGRFGMGVGFLMYNISLFVPRSVGESRNARFH
jgi:hypothetical protein